MIKPFKIVCPFCENISPFRDNSEEIYRCQCGSIYKITPQSDIEFAVNQLALFFLEDEILSNENPDDSMPSNTFIFENIQDLISIKKQYEEDKCIRKALSFEQNYPQKIGIIWLGNINENNLSSRNRVTPLHTSFFRQKGFKLFLKPDLSQHI